jgi:hypothetical protein
MTPRRAADSGTAATLAPPNPLARLQLQPARRASARGATIGRFFAAGDRFLEPVRHLQEHRSRELAPIEVFGAALRGPRTAAARQTARRGPGGRPRCSAPRCLASSTLGLPVTSSCTMSRPSTLAASADTTRPPRPEVRSTRMVPSNRNMRWVSSGGTRSSMYFSSSLRRCSASRGWVLESGRLDLPGHLWAASSAGCGCAPPSPPVAAPALPGVRRSATAITHRVLTRPCGCGRRLLWPVFGGAATRPGTLLQGLSTSKCWLYACDQGHVDFVRISWG